MNEQSENAKTSEKLMAQAASVMERHRASILPLLGGTGNLSRAALQNDETVRRVAIFTYALLPGLVRFVVKEPAYVDFVLANRQLLLAKLLDNSTM